ncbi:unnamed protein product [Trichogramma brassicae]|uniref:CCHC-type domain-containing protein n=1 Tax=Trichogramma brassicae TaxID=86971 RepID=A0A6H5I9W5_9HYME|nr:unnamed protein product [Trichogramma brassicae]
MPKSLTESKKAAGGASRRLWRSAGTRSEAKARTHLCRLPTTKHATPRRHKVAAVSEVDEENSRGERNTPGQAQEKKRTPKKEARTRTEESVRRVQNAPHQADDRFSWPTSTKQRRIPPGGAARGNNSRFGRRVFHMPRNGPSRQRIAPQRRCCFRCQETGHLAPSMPQSAVTSCQVCGNTNAEFRKFARDALRT